MLQFIRITFMNKLTSMKNMNKMVSNLKPICLKDKLIAKYLKLMDTHSNVKKD